MKRDVLHDAARALRDETEAPPSRGDATRARVMASLRRQRSRRVVLVRAAVPLAAVFVGSLAWAAASGLLPSPFRAPAPAIEAPAPSPSAPSSTLNTAPNTPAPPPEDTPPPSPPSEEKQVDDVAPAPQPLKATSIAPSARASASKPPPLAASSRESAPAASAQAAASAPAPVGPDEHALYTAAHRLHFVERNPSAALAAWDAYLRAAPGGRFSLEAHYNRALCLVRLGRAAEAKPALERFARGAYGGYRQAEARALLDAMGP